MDKRGAVRSLNSRPPIAFPTCSPSQLRNLSPDAHLGLTCHFQGLQICQAGLGTITDGIDHGTWGGGRSGFWEQGTTPVPSPRPSLVCVVFPRSLPFPRLDLLSTHPCIPPRSREPTQYGAPAGFIHAQDTGLFATHGGHGRAQATAPGIVLFQLAEVHTAAPYTCSHGGCRFRFLRAFSDSDQLAHRTRPDVPLGLYACTSDTVP